MAAAEFGDWFVHVMQAERQGQCNPKSSAELAVFLSKGRLCLLKIRENSHTTLMKTLPGLSDVQASSSTPDQLNTQTYFECRHATTDGRLRDAESIRSRRKAAGLHHGHKRLQVVESVHIVAIFRTI